MLEFLFVYPTCVITFRVLPLVYFTIGDLSMAIMTSWVTALITPTSIEWRHTDTSYSSNDRSKVGFSEG